MNGERRTHKEKFFELYQKAHENGVQRLLDARVLFARGSYPGAYYSAFAALEEISKSQAAADVFTGSIDEVEFYKLYRDHQKKIGRIGWAYQDAGSTPYNQKWVGPDRDDVQLIYPSQPDYRKKSDAWYVSINAGKTKITSPINAVSEKDAADIIHIAEVALARIYEVVEYGGHQIGTKGFMK